MKNITLFLLIVLFFTACSKGDSEEQYSPKGEILPQKKLYIVGVHPYLNSKKMYSSYRPILEYLQDNIPNSTFVLETSFNYASYNKKLYNEKFQFSLPNPFQTYNALKHNYKVIAKMKPDSAFRGIIVSRKENNLSTVMQLKNRALSFPAPTALAATMMPLYYLYENGVDITTIEQKYVGSQYSSILNAYRSDTIAGATWPPPWRAWCIENPKKAKEMEVVWETKPLINNGFIVHNSVDKNLSTQVAALLIALDKSEKGAQILLNAGFEGFEASSNANYSIVEEFLKKYNRALGDSK